ncbi:uncharacterized protein LOC142979540 [Anticarsia gemmatalis]|uniref:uncharacterized protein LOC142979540 n=1 Tax=Anticarsia gemmatalis TaxID=129554 RepID=UPI003F767465
MALDKQRILNELGSVVNQLQSADCGCMGKLFSGPGNSNAMPGHCGGGMQGCCGHGYHGHNAPCAGEPYSGARQCMGYCNPPKLYADTYNYLNHNLMQPVVKEVYDDLKSITPANTIMNNPMGAQMGLAAANNPNSGSMMAQNSMPGGGMGNPTMDSMRQPPSPHFHFGNSNPNNTMQMNNPNGQGMGQMGQGMGQMAQGPGQMGQASGQMSQGMAQMGQAMSQMGQGVGQIGQGMGQMSQGMGQMGQAMGQGASQMNPGMGQMSQGMGQMGHGPSAEMLGGMGPQIVNMMNSSSKSNNPPNQGMMSPNPAGSNMPQTPGMNQMPSNMPGNAGQGQYNPGQMQNNAGYMGGNNMSPQGNPGMQTNQYMTQPNMPAQGNAMPGNMNQMNPATQQMGNVNANPQQMANSSYGQHSASMAKFKEMFPGVLKEDLGFDPMSIAFQMNPANQQKSAIDTMNKMLMGNSGGINRIMDASGNATPAMKPVLNATNAAVAGVAQPQVPPQQVQQNMAPAPVQQQQPGTAAPMQNTQQVYTALTGAPAMNQQQLAQQPMMPQQMQPQQIQQMQQQQLQQLQPAGQPQQYQQQQEQHAANARPLTSEGFPNTRPRQPVHPAAPLQHMYKEPIFPADTSRNLLHSHHFAKSARQVQYNTLGQPIEMQNPREYYTPIPDLPQTLSPQTDLSKARNSAMKYSNVKATISKTSLMGNRPVGRTPSRSQLQHIYNQYKGSQSFTQQNIKPSDQGVCYSAGHISIPQSNTPRHTPVERVGGDTAANVAPPTPKLEPIMDQIGDVPVAAKPFGDAVKVGGARNNPRNGLQDQVFTSSPTSAKWSFHGDGRAVPFSVGYRFRNK